MSIAEDNLAATCQICLYAVEASQQIQVCSSCGSRYHQECWNELGGCATYGCQRMVEVKKAEDVPATFWGATEKNCPICVELIPLEAMVCRYCKTKFKDDKPLTRDELLPQQEDPSLREYRRGAVWLFVFSLLGCTSPFALIFGGLWYRSHRKEIAEAGGTAVALSLIGLGICVLYLVVMGFSLLVWSISS